MSITPEITDAKIITRRFLNDDKELPKDGIQLEYTEEHRNEILKCAADLIYFAENYFYIENLDDGEIKIQLHDCQKRVLGKLIDSRFFVLLASRQIGKCLQANELCKIRHKKTKEIQEIPVKEIFSLTGS